MKSRLIICAMMIVLCVVTVASTSTLSRVTTGDTIRANDINQYVSALESQLVPRALTGVPTNIAGSLGYSNYRWRGIYGSVLYGSNYIAMDELNGSLRVRINSTPSLYIGATGMDAVWLQNKSITTVKHATGAVQKNAIGLAYAFGSSSVTASTSNTSFTDTGISVSITTKGHPVMLMVQSGSDAAFGYIGCAAAGYCEILFQWVRDSTAIAQFALKQDTVTTIAPAVPAGLRHVDVVSAGTYTYKLQYKIVSGSQNAQVTELKVVAHEI